MKSKLLVYIILLALIVVTAAGGTAVLVVNKNKVKGYERTEATVVGHKEKDNGYDDFGKKYLYAEIVEYSVDGVKYKSQNNVWSSNPKKVGSRIEVAYDPSSPSTCVFVKSNNFLSIVLYIFSGGFLLALIIQVLHDRRRREYD